MNITKTRTKRYRYILKWVIWVLLVQLVLINISAAFYAHKLSHFYEPPTKIISSQNIFSKTWKLFVGPRFYKNTIEPEPAFPYETIQLKTSDNILIDAWYGKADSSQTCIIFFHGITTNKSFLSKEASIFRSWGYNVMLVDLRAHGKSGGSTSSFGVRETDEVQRSFEWALANGNEKIILYGISLGAGVCIKAVSENKIQPLAIIADMPFGSLHQHLAAKARNLGFPSEPFATLVTLWMGIERGFNGFRHQVSEYAKNVHCPVLVQWGEQDSYVSRDEVNDVYENLASQHKKMVVYPGADHQSYLEVDVNAWQKQVRSFLETLQ
jgi:uncharacterized protein